MFDDELSLAFPADERYEFKKRMYRIRIEKLERKIYSLERRVSTVSQQNEYYIRIIKEKNELINQLRGVIVTLEHLLTETVEVLKNETNNATVS